MFVTSKTIRRAGLCVALMGGVVGVAAPAHAMTPPVIGHCNYSYADHTLSEWSGYYADVEQAQCLLGQAGHHVTIDGSFGPSTLGAVEAFQSQHGLTRDGVVGPDTWAALNQY